MTQLIFVTGRPGVGKTSVLLRTVDSLKNKNFEIGGMMSREVREGGVRVGFEIVDLHTGKRGWLAHVDQPTGPRVGKYQVNLKDLDAVGTSSIVSAVTNDDVVIVDEIGPMELFSQAFKDAVERALKSGKPVLGTIHYRLQDPFVQRIKTRDDTEILEVTQENREALHRSIAEKVISYLERSDIQQSS